MKGLAKTGARAGFTLLEVVVAGAIIVIILGAMTSTMDRSARNLQDAAAAGHEEARIWVALERIEQEIEYGAIHVPSTRLSGDAAPGPGGALELLDATGFPNVGSLLLFPGQPNEESITYRRLLADPDRVVDLKRGAHCTDRVAHPVDSLVLWGGSAVAIEDQNAPPAALWDGIALDNGRDVFFRGMGHGVVFRRPVDPSGEGNYLGELGGIRWGAKVDGTDTTSGWSCLYFAPEQVLDEATLGLDVNQDGDLQDRMDVGRIRLRSWDESDPDGPVTDTGLTLGNVIQERCAWGGDLDGDGRDDPLFLWDPIVLRLRVRLFTLHTAPGVAPRVRSTDSAFFLRNGFIE